MRKLIVSLPLCAMSLCALAHPKVAYNDTLKAKSKNQKVVRADQLPVRANQKPVQPTNQKPIRTDQRPIRIDLRPLHPEDSISAKEMKAINSINDTSLVLDDDIPIAVDENSKFENELYQKRLDSLKQDIPLSYNQYVQSYIDLYAYKRRHLVERLMGEGQYYFPILAKALKEGGVPDQLKYLSIIESNLNPFAVSPVGATGPWQFMFGTAKTLGLQMNSVVDERRDPAKASVAAAQYLRESYDYYGDWLLVIASYNCGRGNVDKAIRRSGGARSFWAIQSYLPKETRGYVPAFIAATYIFSYAKQHGLHATTPEFSVANDTVLVNNRISIATVASNLSIDGQELKRLNPQYKRGFIDASADRPMQMVLPISKKQTFVALRDKIPSGQPSMGIYQTDYREDASPVRRVATQHRVRRGETLSEIADRYDVTVQDLKVWNHLHHLAVSPGQRLKIKGRISEGSGGDASGDSYADNRHTSRHKHGSSGSYRVKKGDTLSTIAERLNIPVSRLRALNNLRGHGIRLGQYLRV